MSKKHAGKKGHGNVNRLLLRRWARSEVEDRLWDRRGRLWTRTAEDLPVEIAEALYFDETVPVAIYESARTLRWVDPGERRAAWTEISDRAFDSAWTPPADAPGALPFEAQEWRSGDDRLLLFDDHD